MQIRDMTKPEADYFRTVCNFTKEENTLFELRLQDIPLDKCAERMDITIPTVKRISQRVNSKISREI